MNQAARILIALGLLAGGTLAVWALDGMSYVEPEPPPHLDDSDRATGSAALQTGESKPRDDALEPTLERSRPGDRELSLDHADQGITGRVLRPDGAPARGLLAVLTGNQDLDAVAGEPVATLAQTATDEDGTFRLGVAVPGVGCDLWVLGDDHPDLRVRNVRVEAKDWYDAGDLRLSEGAIVQGFVIEEQSKRPIPGAAVHLQTVSLTEPPILLPGREQGLVAIADDRGCYRFHNGPNSGLFNLLAEAPGFASMVRMHLQVTASSNEFRLELAPGLCISGRVQSGDGQRIAGATVEARALTDGIAPVSRARTATDGSFEIAGLRAGPVLLEARAPGYEPGCQDGVAAGTRDLEVTLARAARVRLKVLSAAGAPVKKYGLSLRYDLPWTTVGIEPVPYFADREVGPADHDVDGFATVSGIHTTGRIKRLVFAITEHEHAATLSQPFEPTADEPLEVVVEMTRGGAIAGRVVDENGRAVAAAVVSTAARGSSLLEGDDGSRRTSVAPAKATRTETRTDAEGQFRLERLAYADYELRVAHPSFCVSIRDGITIDVAEERRIPDIRLVRGSLIAGIAMLDGRPQGQIRIQVTPVRGAASARRPADHTSPAATAAAYSDNHGRFAMPRRLPPGSYLIHASKQLEDGNMLTLVIQMRQTERKLSIVHGEEHQEVRIEIRH